MSINNKSVYESNPPGYFMYYDGSTWILTDTPYNKTGNWWSNGCDVPSCDFGANVTVTGFIGTVSDANGSYVLTDDVSYGLPIYQNDNGWSIACELENGGWVLSRGLKPNRAVCACNPAHTDIRLTGLTFDTNAALSTNHFANQPGATATYVVAPFSVTSTKHTWADGYREFPTPWNLYLTSSSSSFRSSSSSISSVSSLSSDSSKSSSSSNSSSSQSSKSSSSLSSQSSSSSSKSSRSSSSQSSSSKSSSSQSSSSKSSSSQSSSSFSSNSSSSNSSNSSSSQSSSSKSSSSRSSSSTSSESSSSASPVSFCIGNGTVPELRGTYVSTFTGTGQTEVYSNGNGSYVYFVNGLWGIGPDVGLSPVYRKSDTDNGNPQSTNPWDANDNNRVIYVHEVLPGNFMEVNLPLMPCATISSSSVSSISNQSSNSSTSSQSSSSKSSKSSASSVAGGCSRVMDVQSMPSQIDSGSGLYTGTTPRHEYSGIHNGKPFWQSSSPLTAVATGQTQANAFTAIFYTDDDYWAIGMLIAGAIWIPLFLDEEEEPTLDCPSDVTAWYDPDTNTVLDIQVVATTLEAPILSSSSSNSSSNSSSSSLSSSDSSISSTAITAPGNLIAARALFNNSLDFGDYDFTGTATYTDLWPGLPGVGTGLKLNNLNGGSTTIETTAIVDNFNTTAQGGSGAKKWASGTAMTVSFWIKINECTHSNNYILGADGGNASSTSPFSVCVKTNQIGTDDPNKASLSIKWEGAGGQNEIYASDCLPIGQQEWAHVTIRMDVGSNDFSACDGKADILINGVAADGLVGGTTSAINNRCFFATHNDGIVKPLFLKGFNNSGPGDPIFDASLTDFRIYNKWLNNSEAYGVFRELDLNRLNPVNSSTSSSKSSQSSGTQSSSSSQSSNSSNSSSNSSSRSNSSQSSDSQSSKSSSSDSKSSKSSSSSSSSSKSSNSSSSSKSSESSSSRSSSKSSESSSSSSSSKSSKSSSSDSKSSESSSRSSSSKSSESSSSRSNSSSRSSSNSSSSVFHVNITQRIEANANSVLAGTAGSDDIDKNCVYLNWSLGNTTKTWYHDIWIKEDHDYAHQGQESIFQFGADQRNQGVGFPPPPGACTQCNTNAFWKINVNATTGAVTTTYGAQGSPQWAPTSTAMGGGWWRIRWGCMSYGSPHWVVFSFGLSNPTTGAAVLIGAEPSNCPFINWHQASCNTSNYRYGGNPTGWSTNPTSYGNELGIGGMCYDFNGPNWFKSQTGSNDHITITGGSSSSQSSSSKSSSSQSSSSQSSQSSQSSVSSSRSNWSSKSSLAGAMGTTAATTVTGFTGTAGGANGGYYPTGYHMNGLPTYKNDNGYYMFWDGSQWVITDTPYNKRGSWVGNGSTTIGGGIFDPKNGCGGSFNTNEPCSLLSISNLGNTTAVNSWGFEGTYELGDGLDVNGHRYYKQIETAHSFGNQSLNNYLRIVPNNFSSSAATHLGFWCLMKNILPSVQPTDYYGNTTFGWELASLANPASNVVDGVIDTDNTASAIYNACPSTLDWDGGGVNRSGDVADISDASDTGKANDGSPASLVVSGFTAPKTGANGTYTLDGNFENGKPTYSNGNGWYMFWDKYQWVITDTAYDKTGDWVGNANGNSTGTFQGPGNGFGGQTGSTAPPPGAVPLVNRDISGFTGGASGANGSYYTDGGFKNGKETWSNGNGWYMFWDGSQWVITNVPYEKTSDWIGNGGTNPYDDFNQPGSPLFTGQTGLCSAGPFAIDGYYPLYTTATLANAHAGGNGLSHTHVFGGITYYMPSGLGGSQYHGNYSSSSSSSSYSSFSSNSSSKSSSSQSSQSSSSQSSSSICETPCVTTGSPPTELHAITTDASKTPATLDITYSFMIAGTGIDNRPNPSVGIANLITGDGSGALFKAEIADALNDWKLYFESRYPWLTLNFLNLGDEVGNSEPSAVGGANYGLPHVDNIGDIRFGVVHPGDYDGPNGVLAHAFADEAAGWTGSQVGQVGNVGMDVHIDGAEVFKQDHDTGNLSQVSLRRLVVHEVGHSFGMGHACDPLCIMHPYVDNQSFQTLWPAGLGGAEDVCAAMVYGNPSIGWSSASSSSTTINSSSSTSVYTNVADPSYNISGYFDGNTAGPAGKAWDGALTGTGDGAGEQGTWYSHDGNAYLTAGWTGQDFGPTQKAYITEYKIYPWNHTFRTNDPKNWVLQGSNNVDLATDVGWVDLDTQSNQSFTRYNWNTYQISNPGAYRYYRINITANNSGAYLAVQEVELVGYIEAGSSASSQSSSSNSSQSSSSSKSSSSSSDSSASSASSTSPYEASVVATVDHSATWTAGDQLMIPALNADGTFFYATCTPDLTGLTGSADLKAWGIKIAYDKLGNQEPYRANTGLVLQNSGPNLTITQPVNGAIPDGYRDIIHVQSGVQTTSGTLTGSFSNGAPDPAVDHRYGLGDLVATLSLSANADVGATGVYDNAIEHTKQLSGTNMYGFEIYYKPKEASSRIQVGMTTTSGVELWSVEDSTTGIQTTLSNTLDSNFASVMGTPTVGIDRGWRVLRIVVPGNTYYGTGVGSTINFCIGLSQETQAGGGIEIATDPNHCASLNRHYGTNSTASDWLLWRGTIGQRKFAGDVLGHSHYYPEGDSGDRIEFQCQTVIDAEGVYVIGDNGQDDINGNPFYRHTSAGNNHIIRWSPIHNQFGVYNGGQAGNGPGYQPNQFSHIFQTTNATSPDDCIYQLNWTDVQNVSGNTFSWAYTHTSSGSYETTSPLGSHMWTKSEDGNGNAELDYSMYKASILANTYLTSFEPYGPDPYYNYTAE